MFTARAVPFECINETINFQQSPLIAKIDDFRRLTIWKGSNRHQFRYWPKDVGRAKAISKLFSIIPEPWKEVWESTIFMLVASDMERKGEPSQTISLAAERVRVASTLTSEDVTDGTCA
jgi:hypothetical protein